MKRALREALATDLSINFTKSSFTPRKNLTYLGFNISLRSRCLQIRSIMLAKLLEGPGFRLRPIAAGPKVLAAPQGSRQFCRYFPRPVGFLDPAGAGGNCQGLSTAPGISQRMNILREGTKGRGRGLLGRIPLGPGDSLRLRSPHCPGSESGPHVRFLKALCDLHGQPTGPIYASSGQDPGVDSSGNLIMYTFCSYSWSGLVTRLTGGTSGRSVTGPIAPPVGACKSRRFYFTLVPL